MSAKEDGGAHLHSINGLELPSDPADLFVTLYDALPDTHFRGAEAWGWHRDGDTQQLAEEVYLDVLDHGDADTWLTREIVARHGARGMFATLVGLDMALNMANPFGQTFDAKSVAWLTDRYSLHGCLNDPLGRTTGLLLPRCAWPGTLHTRPTGKAEFFKVHRVPQDMCDRVKHACLIPRNGAHFSGKEAISLGAVPLMEQLDEQPFEFHEEADQGLYRIRINDRPLYERLDKTMRNLEQSGAKIAILPEYALSAGLLDHWRTLLDTEPRPGSALQWLLLGSGPVGDETPPPNRAILIDRFTGETLLEHDKTAGFTLAAGQAADWELPNRPTVEPVDEDITLGDKVTVLETSLGRIAVLICEDIKQSTDWEAPLRAFGVSHLFVPILSTPISKELFRWEQQTGHRCVDVLGTWVVFSNSLALGEHLRHRFDPDDYFNCLVLGPRSRRPQTYANHYAQFCRSVDGAGLAHVVHDGDRTYEDRGPLPGIHRGSAE